MKRKLPLAFMTALALGACSNAVGPNALNQNPFDPVNEEAGKEEYYNPMQATPTDTQSSGMTTAAPVHPAPDPVD